MIHILLKGRLGNNLFQIAAGASLAEAKHTRFCIYAIDKASHPGLSSSYEELISLKETLLRSVEIRKGKPECGTLYKETQFNYSPIPFQDELILNGYFQSEKFFSAELVRNMFRIDHQTKDYIEQKYGHLLKKEITSIHIRRGDYLANLDFHPICMMNYFRRAINRIGKEKRFLIVSNDVAWCKKRFKGPNFFFTEGESALVDLYLQSLCTNNIISNSSFSWWGAWLNENPRKTVICPDPWFGISAKHMDTRDLLPDSWVKIPNRMPLPLNVFAYLRKSKRWLYRSLVINKCGFRKVKLK